MNKTIVKVFVILGILVLALLIWAFVSTASKLTTASSQAFK